MKFFALGKEERKQDQLREEYNHGHEIGVIRVGETCLFFKKGFRGYYIPYSEVQRFYRRVMLVPAKMCCGKGDFEIENLVIATENGEVAQIQIPGKKAALVLMDELMAKAPGAKFTKPVKSEKSAEE